MQYNLEAQAALLGYDIQTSQWKVGGFILLSI